MTELERHFSSALKFFFLVAEKVSMDRVLRSRGFIFLLAAVAAFFLGSFGRSFQRRGDLWSGNAPLRSPAAIPAAAARSLLAEIIGDSKSVSDRMISEWILNAKLARDIAEAGTIARRLRVNIAAVSRSELEGNAELRDILFRDVASLGPHEIATLQKWLDGRIARIAGLADTDRAVKLAREAQKVLQRDLIPVSEGRSQLRRVAMDFMETAQPRILEGTVEQSTLLDAIQAARIGELQEDQAVELLQTIDAMISYHGPEWDGARSVRQLRELDAEALGRIRAEYRQALLTGEVDSNLMLLAGRLAAAPKMLAEQEFAKARDTYLTLIDRLRWFTSNPIRATEQDLHRKISEFDYLIRIGDKKAVRATIQSKFLMVETSALYIRRLRAVLAEATARQAGRSEISKIERMIAQQESILGGSFEEYRALRQHLSDLIGERAGTCDAACSRFASEIEASTGLTEMSLKTFVVSFDGMARPTLQEVTETFYSSVVAQEASLRISLFAEVRSTLLTMASSVVMLKEFQRIAAKIPELGPRLRWTRGVLFFLYDTRARQIHFPQLSRIMRARGGVAEQIQMLEQMALPPNDDLLVTFARRMDQDYRDAWKQLKKQAQSRFESGVEGADRSASLIARMEDAEGSATALGGISAHFEHSPAVKLGGLVVAGYGGYAWYQSREDQKKLHELAKELGDFADAAGKARGQDGRPSAKGEIQLSEEVQRFLERVKRLQLADP